MGGTVLKKCILNSAFVIVLERASVSPREMLTPLEHTTMLELESRHTIHSTACHCIGCGSLKIHDTFVSRRSKTKVGAHTAKKGFSLNEPFLALTLTSQQAITEAPEASFAPTSNTLSAWGTQDKPVHRECLTAAV